jgi:Predicted acyltransferases
MNRTIASASSLAVSDGQSIDAHSKHRRDLDGLRAVAALSVVACHTSMPLPGGATGVDMFFVLSGFLISGILLRSLLHDSFSFSDFYSRRIRRIFPALVVVLFTVWLVGSVLLLPEEYRRLGKDIATSATFSLHIFGELEHNFAPLEFDSGGTLLDHLWSLGVEEQFYLLWPLFLLTIWRFSKRRILYVAVSIAIVMLVSFGFLVAKDNESIGLVPWRGLWELSAGGLVACVQLVRQSEPRTPLSSTNRDWRWLANPHLSGAAAASMLVTAIVSHPSSPVLSNLWTVVPAGGTLLLISSAQRSFLSTHILGTAPMSFIGQISYPLYLWHFPVLSIISVLLWDHPQNSAVIFTIVIVTSLLLAFLTNKFVEIPIRFYPRRTATTATLVGLMILSGAVGIAVLLGAIRPFPNFRDQDLIRSTTEDWLNDSNTDSWTKFPDGIRTLGHGSRHALFIGDSNMQQYYPRIEKLVFSNALLSRNAMFATKYGCAPGIVEVLIEGERLGSTCRKYLDDALAYAADPSVDTVVIAASWYAHLLQVQSLSSIGHGVPLKPEANLAVADVKSTLSRLTGAGKRVYLVLNLPVGAGLDPRAHLSRTELLPSTGSARYTEENKKSVETALEPIATRLKDVAKATGAVTIDPLQFLCNETSCPWQSANGKSMYRDLWHLRPSYVRDQVKYLDFIMLDQ